MSSTLSTQKRQTFLRRKYCFLPVAIALSPPVGRCEAAIGRPPLCSAMRMSFLLSLNPIQLVQVMQVVLPQLVQQNREHQGPELKVLAVTTARQWPELPEPVVASVRRAFRELSFASRCASSSHRCEP